MKIKTIFSMSFILAIGLLVGVVSCNQNGMLTFPFSQFTISAGHSDAVWKYEPYLDIEENENVIAPPEFEEDWKVWYKKMKDYQAYLRANVNDQSKLTLLLKENCSLNFKRVLNDYDLQPKDKISINGLAKSQSTLSTSSIALVYIERGKEKSRMIETMVSLDSVQIGKDWTKLSFEVVIPDFDVSSLSVQPILVFKGNSPESDKILVKDLILSIPDSESNRKVFDQQKKMLFPESKSVDNQVYERPELDWMKNNFLYNFVMLWDADLWDAERKEFTVDKYCKKMRKEFGGVQSVLLWFCYPNLGLDNQNTWDFVDAISGGIEGLKNVVSQFHKNGVKVFFSYTPWDIDTRRSQFTDAQNWARIIGQVDADGLFFDTWPNIEDFREEFDQYNKGVSIHTELQPTLQNIQSYYAVTSSWGQGLRMYNNNGISRLKWFNPEHIQWTIARWENDRQNTLAYTWINGQGLVIWENIFGTLNFWNAQDRSDVRKMNAIYQHYGSTFTSDTWNPYLPSGHPNVHISSWENEECRIWNIITDKKDLVNEVTLPIDDGNLDYYNLWTGEKLLVNGSVVNVPLKRFGCVVGLKSVPSKEFHRLLDKQKLETSKVFPTEDLHAYELSTKEARPYPKIISSSKVRHSELLEIPNGKYQLEASHVKREGGCYPNIDAKDNNDLVVEKNMIFHKVNVNLPTLSIMPRVVTNSDFDVFLKETKYEPSDKHNFLKHWGEKLVCPEAIKDEPVVFVSLDDARAYAKWAGMRLPTEWEWQVAGELHGNDFNFNEVWEWNESERTDGHNLFVTLRGGSKDWKLTTSHWYFPSTPDMRKGIGGPQPLASHCKYYIMKVGFDRAGTLGFRCIK